MMISKILFNFDIKREDNIHFKKAQILKAKICYLAYKNDKEYFISKFNNHKYGKLRLTILLNPKLIKLRERYCDLLVNLAVEMSLYYLELKGFKHIDKLDDKEHNMARKLLIECYTNLACIIIFNNLNLDFDICNKFYADMIANDVLSLSVPKND